MSLKQAALDYASRGFYVFPLKPRSKDPATRHGHKDAETDPGAIEYWWDHNPEYNIGLACEPSGLAVIDLDGPHDDLAGELPETLEAETRPGRKQLFYSGDIPSGVKNLGEHTDTRGRGGYVVVAPSVHPSTGEPYRWLNDLDPSPVPDWIPEALSTASQPAQDGPGGAGSHRRGRTTRYGATALDALTAAVLRASEGERNITLFRNAVRVSELIRSEKVEGSQGFTEMRRAAGAAGLGKAEVERTLKSAWNRARRQEQEKAEASPSSFETLDVEALRNLPPPEWLLDGILPEGVTLLVGRYGSLKSWVALDWAVAAALSGRNVVFFVGEDANGFAQRVVDLADDIGEDPEKLAVVNDVPKLLQIGEPERLHETVEEGEVDLIVLDTWAKTIPGVDENAFVDQSKASDVLKGLMDRHRCSSLVVAHTNAFDKRMRGHTSVEDAADCIWHARKDGDIRGAATLSNPKMKNAPESPDKEVLLRTTSEDRVVLVPSMVSRLMEEDDE